MNEALLIVVALTMEPCSFYHACYYSTGYYVKEQRYEITQPSMQTCLDKKYQMEFVLPKYGDAEAYFCREKK